MRPSRLLLPAVLAAGALVLSGCVNNEAAPSGSGASSGPAVKVDKAAAALLPKDVSSAGVLKFGTDAAYPPNEYKDPSGTPVGWEIELTNAMAAKLGLTARYSIAKFDNILPSIIGGKYDVGVSSFFDTKEREQKADMVDYYKVGTQWAAPTGKTVDPNGACGLKVAVQNGTTEALTDVPAKSKACTDAGKAEIQILGFDQQDDATSAVTLGRADAVAADSPVLQYAVKKSGGKLALAGAPYDVFFYGMPVQKNRGTLAKALATGLQDLIDDGTYTAILKKWGVEAGAIDTMNINGAVE